MASPDRLKHALLLAALAGLALYSLWYTFRAWRENRLVADTPTSRIRSAAQGYVEIIGHGLMPDGRENPAPLSRRPCTWWRYKIEEQGGSGRSRRWTAVDRGESEIPFLIDDGTGRCLVDPRGAEVYPAEKDVWYGNTEWPEVRLPPLGGVFGKVIDALLSGGRYRYTEYRMRPNETVCALGAYQSISGGLDRPEEAVAELLRDWKHDQAALLKRFDANHDGVIDAAEWEAARAAARHEVVEKMMTPAPAAAAAAGSGGTGGTSLGLLSKPADGRAFLLAASDGASLAVRLRRQASVGLAGSLAASAAIVWLITHASG
ncbi:MAG TPA: GIDE domain-containing protein [Steroidobacteraceae bacterium]|nr:GIDE domain-containing protein [Steroidobacteraceae bacterium]